MNEQTETYKDSGEKGVTCVCLRYTLLLPDTGTRGGKPRGGGSLAFVMHTPHCYHVTDCEGVVVVANHRDKEEKTLQGFAC
jgi:hypothetical protein